MISPYPIVPLGDVIRHRKEFIEIDDLQEYRRPRVQLHAKGIVLRDTVAGAAIKTKKQQVCRAGEFLVAEIDAKVGGFGIVPIELDAAIVSSHYFLFEIDAAVLDRRFLGYFVQTLGFRDQIEAQGSTNYAAIRPQHVLDYSIPLPPLDEQRRIVARIEELAAKIEQARRLHGGANDEISSLLGRTVERLFGSGVQNGWPTRPLGSYLLDTTYGTSEKTVAEAEGTPILRMGNIQNGRLRLSDLRYLHLSDRDRNRLVLLPGDILVNRTNSAELVGKCAVFDLRGEYAFASYLIRLRVDNEQADPRLIAHFINSPIGRRYMFQERKQMTGQANINATTLKALPIPLPCLNEQQELVTFLDEITSLTEGVAQIASAVDAELAALLPSVLNRSLHGEI